MKFSDEPSADSSLPEPTEARRGVGDKLGAAAVVVADEQGFITDVDARFEQLLGWARAEIVGKHVTTIIPRRFRDAHHIGFARFLVSGVPTILDRPVTLWTLTKDGRELRTEHVISAERANGRWVFRATIRPLAAADGAREGEPSDG